MFQVKVDAEIRIAPPAFLLGGCLRVETRSRCTVQVFGGQNEARLMLAPEHLNREPQTCKMLAS